MSLVKDIGDFMEDNSLGIVGTDIFLGETPDQPDSIVGLFEYGGLPPMLTDPVDQPGLQVLARDADYETARSKLQNIQNLLLRIGNEDDKDYASGVAQNGTRYLRAAPVQGITSLGRDALERWEMVQNFYITKGR